MGADATIFVFDHALYRELTVPTFMRLVCEGVMDPWLQEFLQTPEAADWGGAQIDASFVHLPDGFEDCCTYLDSELAVCKLHVIVEREYDGRWEARACRENACAIRDSCPFHISHGKDLPANGFNCLHLLERIIAKRCLGEGQFLGRSIDCSFYWQTLDHLGVEMAHPIRHLLERLGRRGRLVGYRGSSGTEGIHGWLSPHETETLAGHLFALKLPEYDYSFTAMESFRQMRDVLAGKTAGFEYQFPSYAHPDASFEELSLSYVRTVCALASRQGKGVLWGNNIS
jgi:hypothetical protein